jgi:hypothetical protein
LINITEAEKGGIKRRYKIISISNERRKINIDSTDIKRIMVTVNNSIYACIFDNLDDLDKFLTRQKQSKHK